MQPCNDGCVHVCVCVRFVTSVHGRRNRERPTKWEKQRQREAVRYSEMEEGKERPKHTHRVRHKSGNLIGPGTMPLETQLHLEPWVPGDTPVSS